LYSPEPLSFKFSYLPLLIGLLAGCVSNKPENGSGSPSGESGKGQLQNSFVLDQQHAPPDSIHSIRLLRTGSPEDPPVINLESNDKLVLSFDQISASSSQFLIRIRHYSSDWESSPIPPDYYIDGFFETYLSSGTRSFSTRPSYWHYEYEIPNPQLRFKVSGNYLLTVYNADTREELFSLPFFVTENAGNQDTDIKFLFAQRENMRQQDQLFTSFAYPEFVELPRFDLSVVFVQNRFWGRARSARIYEAAGQGFIDFYLPRDRAFLGDYEFNILELLSFNADEPQILEIQPEIIPPNIILRRDIQRLEPPSRLTPRTRFGSPVDDRGSKYGNVHFRLETPERVLSYQKMYVVGDFNQWTIRERNRMEYDASEQLWKGSAIIKEGTYTYKYVILSGNRIDDLTLDQKFSFANQEYISLVYFRDPARNFDRLLNVNQVEGR